MKPKFLLLLALTLSHSLLFAQSKPALINNYCRPFIDSKRYIKNDFHASYPKQVKFECSYECMANNKLAVIPAISTVDVRTIEDDATQVVCQGIRVKKVTWGYDFDGYDLFYAFQTPHSNIKKFAFENINTNNSKELELLNKLKADLNIVGASYLQAGQSNPGTTIGQNFTDAGKTLLSIANDLPVNTSKLDAVIKSIVIQKGQISKITSAQSLVESNLLYSANWKIPNHLF